jgi:hypothetical protein
MQLALPLVLVGVTGLTSHSFFKGDPSSLLGTPSLLSASPYQLIHFSTPVPRSASGSLAEILYCPLSALRHSLLAPPTQGWTRLSVSDSLSLLGTEIHLPNLHPIDSLCGIGTAPNPPPAPACYFSVRTSLVATTPSLNNSVV